MKKGKTLEQLREQKAKQRARLKIFYVFLALVLALSGGYLLITRYFVINEFVVSDSVYYTAQDIIDAADLNLGESLFTCFDGKVEEKICTLLPYIANTDVKKRFPDKIEITVEEQDGVMYLQLGYESYAVNRDMKVLGKVKETQNKIELCVNGVRRCIVGETVRLNDDEDAELVKTLYGALYDADVQDKITKIDVTEHFDIHFNYDDRFEVYIGDEELLDFKIKIFEKVIADFPNDSGKITISEKGRAVINLDDY